MIIVKNITTASCRSTEARGLVSADCAAKEDVPHGRRSWQAIWGQYLPSSQSTTLKWPVLVYHGCQGEVLQHEPDLDALVVSLGLSQVSGAVSQAIDSAYATSICSILP